MRNARRDEVREDSRLTKRNNHLRQPRYSSSKSSTTFPFSCVALNLSFFTLDLFSSLTPPRSVATSASRRAILARNLPPLSSSSEDSGSVSSIFLRFCFFFPAVAEEELARDPAPGVGEAEVEGTRSFAAGTGLGASSAVPD